jgi:MerR HTH family regulatory protein
MREAAWTIDELAERVDAALSVGYDGQPSGRVREVPDRRAIRYYTTLGLLDRPAAMRGRTALYGHRHLLQLVAIKRLQAEGRSLAQVQAELAGASDAQLRRVARLRGDPPGPPPARAATRAGFWRQAPGAPAAASLVVRPAAAAPAPGEGPAQGDVHGEVTAGLLQGIRLGEGVTLLLEDARPLDAGDLRAILAAARPLLGALRARRPHPSGREHP